MFLYIDPLKQGLKLRSWSNAPFVRFRFLYIDPLKQGLKHTIILFLHEVQYLVFIHRSIKTRIETSPRNAVDLLNI